MPDFLSVGVMLLSLVVFILADVIYIYANGYAGALISNRYGSFVFMLVSLAIFGGWAWLIYTNWISVFIVALVYLVVTRLAVVFIPPRY